MSGGQLEVRAVAKGQAPPAVSTNGAGLSWSWAVAAIGAVAYGSLIPFDIDFTQLGSATWFGVRRLAFHATTWEDAVTNLLVYLPVGLALVMCGRCRWRLRLPRIPQALALAFAVSLANECLQAGIHERVASWTDVYLNCTGAMAGAILGVGLLAFARRLWQHLAVFWARGPFSMAAAILTFGLFIYHLAPFDFVSSTPVLQESFLRARWDLTNLRSAAPGQLPFVGMVAQITAAAWFALLAYLGAFAELGRGRTPMAATAMATRNTVINVVLIELLQLFTVSHVFDIAAIALGTLSAGLGAWSAVYLVDRLTGSQWRHSPRHCLPTALLVFLAGGQIAVMLLASFDPQIMASGLSRAAHIRWIPFEGLWRQSMTGAAIDVAASLITYGALTVTLGVILRRARVSAAWVIAALLILLLSLGEEVFDALSLTRAADLTDPIVALISAAVAARVYVGARAILAPATG
ncbi:MAG: VanZ family protein [Planctomycetes bacterium]|nr:VanZ family protein [Planctomycetota bacterium]